MTQAERLPYPTAEHCEPDPDALRLFLRICEYVLGCHDRAWFHSASFRGWLGLVGWSESDFRVRLLRDMAENGGLKGATKQKQK